MGPGYFPIMLGGALVMFGVYFVIQGLRAGAEKLEGSWSLRALIILPLSLVLFGLLIDRAGFIPAMLALIIGSSAASTQFKLVEVLVFAVFLTAMCVDRVRLGARPALRTDHRHLVTPPWISSTT